MRSPHSAVAQLPLAAPDTPLAGNSTQGRHSPDTPQWQTAALRRYQVAERADIANLRTRLAERVEALTGYSPPTEDIFVDREEELAQTVVDGAVLRLHHGELVLVRPCSICGAGQFESPPIHRLEDLGYALTVWQPPCPDWPPDDPVDDSADW